MLAIDVLGTTYEIVFNDEKLKDMQADGACNFYDKIIMLRHVKELLDEDDYGENKKICFDSTLRHELTHAFLYEAGLTSYANDEVLVEWVAQCLPKIDVATNNILYAIEGDVKNDE